MGSTENLIYNGNKAKDPFLCIRFLVDRIFNIRDALNLSKTLSWWKPIQNFIDHGNLPGRSFMK